MYCCVYFFYKSSQIDHVIGSCVCSSDGIGLKQQNMILGLVQWICVKIALNVVKAYNIKIKIRLGGISKIFCFVLTPIWLPQTKAFH